MGGGHALSQSHPEHDRLTRRFGFACTLGVLAILLETGAMSLQEGLIGAHEVTVPRWVLLLAYISGFVLAGVAITLIISVYRELRHLPQR